MKKLTIILGLAVAACNPAPAPDYAKTIAGTYAINKVENRDGRTVVVPANTLQAELIREGANSVRLEVTGLLAGTPVTTSELFTVNSLDVDRYGLSGNLHVIDGTRIYLRVNQADLVGTKK